MKKTHAASLKLHTLYSAALLVIFVAVFFIDRNLTLMATMIFFTLYVAGNSVIHARNNTLTKDILVEYIILAIVMFVVVLGAITH